MHYAGIYAHIAHSVISGVQQGEEFSDRTTTKGVRPGGLAASPLK